MKSFLILLTLLGCSLAVPHHPRRKHLPRIINGQEAAPGQFPYAAALNAIEGYTWCNGVIIDTQWILTTAECLEILFPNDYVTVGSIVGNDTTTSFTIAQAISHEDYDFFTYQNNIGLIQIDGELTYDDNIQAIEIGEVADGATCTIMGWGLYTDSDYPINLQYAEETTVELATCTSLIDDSYYLGEDNVCGTGVEGAAICWGDSGGPLVCDSLLAGISSFTAGDCGQLPDVFTRAASFKDWIDSKISGARK